MKVRISEKHGIPNLIEKYPIFYGPNVLLITKLLTAETLISQYVVVSYYEVGILNLFISCSPLTLSILFR